MIDVVDASFSYPADLHPALQSVSVRLEAGERVGIVGPNGSGKSTLGRLMKGMLLPSGGQVAVDGVDSRIDDLTVRRLVGLVFQNPNSQIVNSIVEQEVAFGPENIGLPTVDVRQRVDEALAAVGLTGQETAECHSLTMADKQRVALASVLALHPRYLILDEPTAWIEPKARWPLFHAVLTWVAARHAGLLLVTHRMDEAQLCDRLYGMLDGEVYITGRPSDVLSDSPARDRLSLEIPEAQALAMELHAAGLPLVSAVGGEQLAEALWPS